MTNIEIERALAMADVTFLPGSYDKRFCQDMLSFAKNNPAHVLTENQSRLLGEKVHRYRKQIKNHRQLCPICTESETK